MYYFSGRLKAVMKMFIKFTFNPCSLFVLCCLFLLSMAHISAFITQNRKNDEASYEKMLKLRRDLSRAVTILEMIKRREKSKRELLHLTLEIFEKR